MKKIKTKYEYRWKIKLENHKTVLRWASTYLKAIESLSSSMKSIGYTERKIFKLSTKVFVVKFIRKHAFGQKIKVLYLVNLPIKRMIS